MTGRKIETKILKSNPILEAFGNATTTRNENSSRFGKYIQLNFNRSGNMKGAAISTYLLEKTRVVHQGPAECNFHIFYQMMQPGLRGIKAIGQFFDGFDQSISFRILPGQSERSAGKDSEMLQNTMKALEEIGVTDSQTKQIFQILLAILYLGNIEFIKGQDEDTTKIKQSKGSSDAMQNACNLLCIDSRQLQHILLHRNIHSGRKGRESMFVKPVRQSEAANRRDCLAMLLYSSLFNWLVSYINDQFHGNSCKQSIGLLDIYGFECFQQNSLEQLCINYANERLQQHYVQHFLRDLQTEYIDENIEWTYTEFEDNQPHIDLLDGTCGVFALLNEEVYLNRPKDLISLGNRLMEVTNRKTSHRQPLTPRLHNKINDSSSAAQRSQKKNSEKFSPRFVIRHFCGVVDYEAREMVEKNKDNIPSEVENLVKTSQLDFVQQIMTSITSSTSTTTTTSTPSKKKKTVLTKFKTSLDQLMLSLNASDVHYVRCLKPNKDCVPNKFDRLFMMSQLKASGILETVEISHQGHPVRMTYADFLRRYSVVRCTRGPASGHRLDGALEDNVSIDNIISTMANKRLQVRERVKRTPTPCKVMRRRTGLASCEHLMRCCAAILTISCEKHLVNPASFCKYFGKNRIFLTQSQFDQLESARSTALNTKVTRIQTTWRQYQKRKTLRRRKKAVLTIEKAVQEWMIRRRLQKERQEQLEQLQSMMANTSELTNNFCQSSYCNQMAGGKSPENGQNRIEERGEDLFQNNNHSSSGGDDGGGGGGGGGGGSSRTNNNSSNNNSTGNRVFWKSFTSHQNPSSVFTKDSLSLETDTTTLSQPSRHQTCSSPCVTPDPSEPPIKRLKMSCEQFTSLQNVSIGDGVVSRRKLPKSGLRFHTRPSLLKNAHVVNQNDIQCSITDILPDDS
ncbi:unconventional myosin-XIX isoform X2 [Octopus bimaculoides]|nr:unconventional myosin-XIX isoform X2 [Octopus bimaculoides]|eukprot:XP_014777364.1 PREDICTED: unconventional myosin-XIX-like isoform X2 [Octopus bimaculoides]